MTGENLGQGSRSAAMVCSMSLSKSTEKGFDGSKHEVKYGTVQLAPMLFQDDSLRLTTTVEGARDGCRRFESIMDSKALDVNIDKSTYLLVGKKRNIERIRSELKKDPLTYKDSIVKEKTTEKWLGSMINASGVKESTLSTINERRFRIQNAIYETISIIEDCRFNRMGALKCGKEIWELAIIPALLNNAEVFSVKDPKVFKALEEFQSKFWRGLLSIPKSCPLPALTYESNSMLMKYRVYSKIINFIKHIHSQNEENLSKQIMNEQISHDWSGLTSVASEICAEMKLSGLLDLNVNKKQFKLSVKRACTKRNYEDLKEQISTYKKMSAIKDEIVKGNGYFFVRICNRLGRYSDSEWTCLRQK